MSIASLVGTAEKHLQRVAAVLKSRNIDLPAPLPLQGIAHPQERVGVKIGKAHAGMQGRSLRADGIGFMRDHPVEIGVDPRRNDEEKYDGAGDSQRPRNSRNPANHAPCPLSGAALAAPSRHV